MPPTDLTPNTEQVDHPPFEVELPRGELIGRYVVVGLLGRGGMGTVYKAYDAQINRALAIKLLHRNLARGSAGDEIGARMLREARAMARLRHPNVALIHDVGVFEQRVFLALEFIDGGTLKQWLAREHSLQERLDALIAAGRGLAAAHAAGLVHRDFKPDNVLVGKDGHVVVTDFGIARLAEDGLAEGAPSSPPPAQAPSERPASVSLTAPLTLTGSVLGTVGYMAPEQALGHPVDAATDQFSFCVTAYTALYGKRPFASDNLRAYVEAIQEPLGPPPAATAVPAWLHRVLARGLSREPGDRFPSMDALLAALTADPAVAARKRRMIGIASVAALLVAASGALAVRHRSEECVPDPGDLGGVWDDAARADVAASFARSDEADGKDIVGRVTKVMDDTAARWTAMKSESCEATRIKKRQPEDAYRLRSECLDRRLNEMRALSTSLRSADKAVVEKALAAAYGLTNVAVCADVPMLRKSGGLPDDPKARADVLEARGELARATSLQLVGRLGDSTSAAEHALALARGANHGSTVAEALHVLGALEVERNEHAKAEAFLTESTWTASRAGADALVVATASLEAFVVGDKLGRPGEARIWLGVADAALARVGASQELELQYEEHKAWVLADGDRAEETIPAQERIAQSYEALYGVHPHTLRALYNLGDARTAVGDHARACRIYERAITMAESIGGPTYAWTGYSRAGHGDCLVAQGFYAEGEREVERAVHVFEATSDTYSEAEALEVMIRSALALGDVQRAATIARKALGLMQGLEGTASLVALVNPPAAEALLRASGSAAAAEAEALCNQAEKEQEILGQVDPSRTLRADALRCLGEARIAAGRPADAVAPLERSLTIPRRTYPGDLARARFDLARALSSSGGDATRAASLARQARDELAVTPGLDSERAAVEKWLTASPAAGQPAPAPTRRR